MRILVGGFGTRGDVQPMLALALALRERGHAVTVCAPPDFDKWTGELGLTYHAVGESMQHLVERAAGRHGTIGPRAALREIPKLVATHYQALEPLARACDVMVASSLTAAGASFGEKFGIRYHYVGFCPVILPSGEHPSPFTESQTLPRWMNRFTWWAGSILNNAALRRAINAERRRMDLPPVGDAWSHVLFQRLLMASEPALGALPGEAPPNVVQTGAWFMPEHEDLPPDVEEFLQAGPVPVYIGFGSMPDKDPVGTSRRVLEAVLKAGARALLSRGWAGLGKIDLPPTVRVIGPTPHGKLFPRCAAVVHHGGAGTTANAARSGVPQVLVPHLMDQFFWCHRVWKLGLSPPPIHRGRLEVAPLAAALRVCLDDAALRERARAFAGRMVRDGLDRAVRIIEARTEPA